MKRNTSLPTSSGARASVSDHLTECRTLHPPYARCPRPIELRTTLRCDAFLIGSMQPSPSSTGPTHTSIHTLRHTPSVSALTSGLPQAGIPPSNFRMYKRKAFTTAVALREYGIPRPLLWRQIFAAHADSAAETSMRLTGVMPCLRCCRWTVSKTNVERPLHLLQYTIESLLACRIDE